MAFDHANDTVVDDLNARLRHAPPQEILKAALEAYRGKIAVVSSFGAESAVLLHMVAGVQADTPVLFLDTGHHFGQTLDYRKTLVQRLGLTQVRDLRPAFQDLALQDPKADLYKTDTDACCAIRKVLPLDRVLRPEFDAWVTGRKRFQASTRAALPVVERGEGDKIKFNPLANWTKADLDIYVAEHDLPAHPLVQFGYPSIGCWPCTKAVEEGADARSGRWTGSEKTECGIHTPRAADGDNVGGDI
jgi:phosphoadenosine phosphosulfate reductase